MSLVERYIFRIAAGAFIGCLVALTGVIWLTSALRQLDVITAQGQTLLVFLSVTSLTLPTLIAVIAPVALFVAAIYALNRLNGDSELIVMSAAGMSPIRLMRPFLSLGLIVAAMVGMLTIYLIPASFQELRDLISRIRADFVANIAQEGQFTTLDNGVTFHYRERSGPALLGIFMQDRRDEGRTVVYLAERGQTVEERGQSYLVLENGSVHRQRADAADSSIVAFKRYAIDLAALNQEASEIVYKPRERSTGDLLMPDTSDIYYNMQRGRFRAELHDRLSAWLFPLAVVFIAFAALGRAKTTRQGRGMAVGGAVVAVAALRIALFAASSAVVRSPAAAFAVWGLPLLTILISTLMITSGSRLSLAVERVLRGLLSLVPAALLPPRLRGA
ncbi:LPS export ABC transporter permease LptF [Enterovirga rhinocerotis]|uniref:Lipopolysaccharide export system permease protein n=1 Tax=Enterovirga rhinocerotis TaxID=1339210 RepID=A0A4R7BVW6_9HYPH|nr:LPS export ABC transporter permease LptF [Enterovirga rhinocerotis]TDR89242.1 lipopolysaccharide export system permease protein [Enterovirga rhinocerotis]